MCWTTRSLRLQVEAKYLVAVGSCPAGSVADDRIATCASLSVLSGNLASVCATVAGQCCCSRKPNPSLPFPFSSLPLHLKSGPSVVSQLTTYVIRKPLHAFPTPVTWKRNDAMLDEIDITLSIV